MFDRAHLDHIVLDVELVLLSVVQAAALSTLAIAATPLMRVPDPLVCAVLATGFLFVLSFWSVAIIHAISFVAWPMDLVHYYFYFGLALLECLTFGQMDRPAVWFAYSSACFVLILLLYFYDFQLIRRCRGDFDHSAPRRALYEHIRRRQILEMTVLVPAGLVFNLASYVVIRSHPETALVVALFQLLFAIVFVVSFTRSFVERLRRMTACIAR